VAAAESESEACTTVLEDVIAEADGIAEAIV